MKLCDGLSDYFQTYVFESIPCSGMQRERKWHVRHVVGCCPCSRMLWRGYVFVGEARLGVGGCALKFNGCYFNSNQERLEKA